MGYCTNCKTNVFLKEDETQCSRCRKTIRYFCKSCKQYFDVVNPETKKRIDECSWCGFLFCTNCGACKHDCPKYEYQATVRNFIIELNIPETEWNKIDSISKKITDYFEKIKNNKDKTYCEFGVPKTYAKESIKNIVTKLEGFKTRDNFDCEAFKERLNEVTLKPIGFIFTINEVRENGTYGQEYRDVFNLCVCLGKLKHKKNEFINKRGVKVKFDTWLKVDNARCKYLDIDELIIKYCPKCNTQFSRSETYCNSCLYKKDSKKHKKGDRFMLTERQSNNPTCKNIKEFRKREEDGTTTQD